MHKPSIVTIVGPTGVGKSKLAMAIASVNNYEIVNCDSRQVYKFLDIGTAKPTIEERLKVKHHLIDICNPNERFDLALFRDMASSAISTIQSRGNIPLLVGGTGQYIWAILEGWDPPKVKPNLQLRDHLQQKAKAQGYLSIYQDLMKRDSKAAQRIDPKNIRRVIRAIEIHEELGQLPNKKKSAKSLHSPHTIIGITSNRKNLYNKIDNRVENMFANGFVDEVDSIVKMGYSLELPSMSSVGYREIGKYLINEMSLSETIQQIKYRTHRIARHQYAWFSLSDPRIHWLNSDENTGNLYNDYLEQIGKDMLE